MTGQQTLTQSEVRKLIEGAGFHTEPKPTPEVDEAPRNKQVKREAAFQKTVIEMAQTYGWRVAHFRAARTANGWATPVAADGKGFPDLFCVRQRTKQRFAAELKVPPNTVTDEQDEWLTALEMCGIPAYTWTPNDWTEIESVLKDGPA